MSNIGVSLLEMRAAALADVRSAHKRASRRVRAVMGDLAKLAEGRAIATNAAWLVAAASKARRGSTVLEGTDWSTGEAVIVRVEIDPAKPPRLQLDAIFRDAKRRAGGEATATTRLREAETAALALAAVMVEIELALDEGAITAAVERARLASPRDMPRLATTPGLRRRDEPLPPHRTFTTRANDLVFVGRGAAHNDALTFQIARPHHLWLHARGVPGAHVIVPLAKNRSCPADLLIDAAHLAAHFSDARGEPVVEVTTAPRKWVRKPRGAAKGAVVIEREKVVTLRLEPERLQDLLTREVQLGK